LFDKILKSDKLIAINFAVDYYNYKKNAIADIPIENIRKSKLEQINAEQEKEFANLEKKKMIVPKLEIDQICLLEFI
jgi:hypothetical protein